jgi:dolichol-phosphate mannosyltransferase
VPLRAVRHAYTLKAVNGAAPASIGLSVVVPTYNERDRLEELVERVVQAWDGSAEAGAIGAIEIIIVDDNSPDGTGAFADALAARRPVREIARGTIVTVMDADLSHPPQLLPRLVRVLWESGADFAVASRYVSGGSNTDVLVRRLMSRAACWAARTITPVRDSMSGFFALRADRAKHARTEARGFKICLELLVRTSPRTVVEVPYAFVGRAAGTSKMNMREVIGFLKQLWNLRRFKAQHGGAQPIHRVVGQGA